MFAVTIDSMNKQLQQYTEGDYDVELVDAVFQMFANNLDLVIKVHDLYIGKVFSFWPISYSTDRS